MNTRRLRLRELNREDLNFFHALLSDKDVMRYIPMTVYEESQTEALLDIIAQDREFATRKGYYYIIEEKESFAKAGIVNLKVVGDDPTKGTGLLGYILFKEFWGRGYAAEAALAMVTHGFHTLNLHRIEAAADPENGGPPIPVGETERKRAFPCHHCRLLPPNIDTILLSGGLHGVIPRIIPLRPPSHPRPLGGPSHRLRPPGRLFGLLVHVLADYKEGV